MRVGSRTHMHLDRAARVSHRLVALSIYTNAFTYTRRRVERERISRAKPVARILKAAAREPVGQESSPVQGVMAVI
jgi:hypothetical protein